ncbi:MAG: ABC transporter ATP-binding protein [Alphaproteobacteria bacterium]|nr:ABC transporter ATP-binding protein [Alphaproteobacteria bacterium]
MTEVLLRAERLGRKLEGDVPVTLVHDIDLEIQRGEFIAITGPSGSGKSSLLYLLGLLDQPTSGRLWLEGVETSSFDEDRLADIRLARLGFVFQANFLLPEFSARENVQLPISRRGKLDEPAARSRVEDLLASLGLKEQADKLPHQMSGGQNQRVAIARALANDPSIIFADEPTGNLDTAASAVVQTILKDLARKQGHTVIVVTHDPSFAAQSDRTIRIVDGAIA